MQQHKRSIALAASVLAASPFLAGAQNLPTTITQVTTYISRTLVGWLSAIFWSLTAIFILWAAFLYLFGASDEDRITRSKQILMYAIVAGIVAIFATIGLMPIINSLFP